MTPKGLILRNATRKDAADLAMLDDLASHGLASWLWVRDWEEADADSPFDLGRRRMLMADEPTSYANGVVAETEDEVCGMAIGYPMPVSLGDEVFVANLDVFKPILKLFGETRGEWLIDSLGCYREHRRRGVGQALIDDQIQRARRSDATAISLVVEDTNLAALGLYEKNGFRFRQAEKAVAFSSRSTAREYQLMTATF